MRATKSIGNTIAPIATAASGAATIVSAAPIAHTAKRSVGRQSYSCLTRSGSQNPCSPQSFCPPSMAANTGDSSGSESGY